jgi:CII-binding regulator of phage lambda lysogenization HflD
MSSLLQQLSDDPGADTSRVGRIEREVMLIEYRLSSMEKRHDSVPIRVTKLEQQFEHMAGQLQAVNTGLGKLTEAVTDIGQKVGKLFTVLMLVGAVLQMAVPAVLRVWFP